MVVRMHRHFMVLTTLLASSGSASAQTPCGANVLDPASHLAGGAGYPAIIDPASADFLVDTRSELLSALGSATSGDIIYVEDSAVIDLSGDAYDDLSIAQGVTIAGGRGRNGSSGALLSTAYLSTMFDVQTSLVRVTGLRLRGPYQAPGGPNGGTAPGGAALRASAGADVEVDNCEIYGWGSAAVSSRDASVDVHHNHIHHNWYVNQGYGVVVAGAGQADIEYNIFDHNRHDIAGTGDRAQGYTARQNLIIGQAAGTNHSFDMHGERENAGCPTKYAGGTIIIEENTFVDPYVESVKVRGAPFGSSSVVRNNRFLDTTLGQAVYQQFYSGNETAGVCATPISKYTGSTTPFQRLGTTPNCFDAGWFRFDTRYQGWMPLGRSDAALSSLAFADFNNDGKADVFKATGGQWQISSAGTGPWTTINARSETLSGLAFGDFNNDGKADVFRPTGTEWLISWSGTQPFVRLNLTSRVLSDLALADFNNDQITDVFLAQGSSWQISYGGATSWQSLNLALTTTRANLGFGDFNADGKADVFRINGSVWQVSWGGTTSWQTLNASAPAVPLSSLRFGNFSGDARADILVSTGDVWTVYDGGTSSTSTYADWAHGSYPVSSVGFADFTNDGKTDVFLSGRP